MSIRDGYSSFKFFEMLEPGEYDAADMPGGGELSSLSLDTQGYDTATIVINIGSADFTDSGSCMTVALMHADSVTTASYDYVSAQDIFGSAWSVISTPISFGGKMALTSGIIMDFDIPAASVLSVQGVWAFGYKGKRRYLKLMLESTGSVNTGSAVMNAIGILGRPANWPVNVIT